MTILERLEQRRLLSLAIAGPETIVPGPQPYYSLDVAVADDGSFLVVTNDDAGANGAVHVVRYSAGGTQLGEAITLDPVDGRYYTSVAASMDADGDAVIVYIAGEPETDASQVYFSRISKDGVVSAPVVVDTSAPTYTEEAFGNAAVSMDSAGRFFVGWLITARRTDHHVKIHAYNADGSSRGNEFDAETFQTAFGGVSQLDLAVTADGNSAVYALHHTYSDNFSNENRAGRVSATGPLGTVEVAGDNGPSVAIQADGSFVIGYQEWASMAGEPFRMTSAVQRYNASGTAVGEPIPIGTSLAPDGKGVHLVTLADHPGGGFVATYVTMTKTDIPVGNGGVDYRGSFNLYAEQFDAAGAAVGPRVLVDSGEKQLYSSGSDVYGELFPRLSVGTDAAGNAVVAYIEETSVQSPRFRLLNGDNITLQNGGLSIFGTAGDDTITVALQGGNIVATRGSLTRTFAAAEVQFISINGFAGNDTITNDTALPSNLSGGEGDDTVSGGDVADKIRGEGGRDSLWGREGNDTIYGEDGVDSLYGNGGRDRIDGGANSDHIKGNGGRDKLFGGHGNDRLYGGPSGDWLYGQIGDDLIMGEGSNDVLYGEAGVDTLSGSAGDDLLVSNGDGLIDHLFGDRGRDTAMGDQDDILAGIETA